MFILLAPERACLLSFIVILGSEARAVGLFVCVCLFVCALVFVSVCVGLFVYVSVFMSIRMNTYVYERARQTGATHAHPQSEGGVDTE